MTQATPDEWRSTLNPDVGPAENARDVWKVEPGQLWQLGRHRVLCGDAMESADVVRLLEGAYPDAAIIDPPYSFALASASSNASKAGRWHDAMNMAYWFSAVYRTLATAVPNGPLWVFTNWRTVPVLTKASLDAGLSIDSMMVWYKDWIGPGGSKGLRPTYELIALSCLGEYGVPNRGVQDFVKVKVGSYKPHGHPAEKPVGVMSHLIGVSDRSCYLDLFLGSGTTLIACERAGASCVGMEIDPDYAARIIHRWHTETGEIPVLLET